jgi:hypothetical protein
MSYCSPTADNKVFCYCLNSLQKIALSWNFLKPKNKIIFELSDSSNVLYKKIADKINVGNNYWAWIDIIKFINNNKNLKISQIMKEIELKELRPSQPIEWINNKTEWLSNFDIEKVLLQYQYDKSLLYKFHGVFTIDFGIKTNSGRCKYSNDCNIDMKSIINSNKKFFGFITNLCRYNEPGTHWTSSFFVLDPNIKSYGAYYYDSVKRPIPKLLLPVFNDIKKQMETLYPFKPFKINVSNIAHQKSNTECGIFSITFQTRWLLLLKRKGYNNVVFNDVISFKKMNDNVMKNLRFKFFRPNINSLLKN